MSEKNKDKSKVKNEIITMDDQETKSSIGSVDSMISLAIKEKVGVEQLEKLMELKHKHEAHEAQKAYHVNFCAMQAEIPAIIKTKSVTNKHGDELYKYAPLEKIVEQIKPYLKKYGFSYRWNEGVSESQGYKRIYCHIVGHGHQETSFFDVPIMGANNMINVIQQVGSSSTYGKRYSLGDVLGLMMDEDDDGMSLNKPIHGKTETKKPEPVAKPDEALVQECRDLYEALKVDCPNDVTDETEAWMSTIELQSNEGIQKVIGNLKTFVNI